MARLFETPDQVRTRIRQQSSQNVRGLGGLLGYMIGSRMSGGIGANPEVKRAEKIQGIVQQIGANYRDKPDPYKQMIETSQALMNAGEIDIASNLMQRAGKLQPVAAEISPDTQKAVRGVVVKGREAQEKRASTMVESMTKINNLATEARKGNRSARGTMVQQVARLAQGAGVITDRDAAAVSGDQNGFAYLLSAIIPGVDVDTQAALRGIDPLGAGFNTDNLLKTADVLLTSGRTSVNNRMADLRTQATEARFRPQGIKALFSGSRNIDALNALKADMGTQGDRKRMPDDEYYRKRKALGL